MRLVDHLSEQQKKQINQMKKPKITLPKGNKNKKQPQQKKEILSEYDIKELMGMSRDTYKRGRGGAMRRK
ncbi:hypothetical protein V7152_17390 [Neobacillus drentensis]|uniref:hypothetical protein n=1 Tax=Neobacillus drentensis TaxID=220684 RepID=UPI002FFF2758